MASRGEYSTNVWKIKLKEAQKEKESLNVSLKRCTKALIPPNMRTKARFLNLFNVIDWLEKIKQVWDSLECEHQDELQFILQKKALGEELATIIQWSKELSKEFKNNGIDNRALAKAKRIMKHASAKNRSLDFKKKVLVYLSESLATLPNEKKILCCSDIIESFFGKFKYRKVNASKGISSDLLAMPLFDDVLDSAMMKQALEETTLKAIKQWCEDYTVPTLRKTQLLYWRNLLSKTG